MYRKYVITHELSKFSFSKSAEYLRFTYPERSLEGIFKTIIRSKRGIINTSITGVGYLKDKIYLEGFMEVQQRISDNHDPKYMYKGKVKIDDLYYIL